MPPGAGGGSGGGGGGPSGGGGEGRGGWWGSVPRVAVIVTAVVAVVALVVVFTRSGGTPDQQRGEVFLQSAGSRGVDPFTESTVREDASPPVMPVLPGSTAGDVSRSVDGDAPGLYGGTRNVASCDVGKQITALKAEPSKNKAFAAALNIGPSDVPGYLRALTPVHLRVDTRVTNHGYRNGSATSYQAVLQAGTAVLVDDRGVPRVRCACGNPLTPPSEQKGTPKRVGHAWPGYRPWGSVVVAPAPHAVRKFVVAGPEKGDWFTRERGDERGTHDKKTAPPVQKPPESGRESQSSEPGKESKPDRESKLPESGRESESSKPGEESKPPESESSKPDKESKSSRPPESDRESKPPEPGSSKQTSPPESDRESTPSEGTSSPDSGEPPSSAPTSAGSSEPLQPVAPPSAGESSKPQAPTPAEPSSQVEPGTSAPESVAPQNDGSAPAGTGQQDQQQQDQQQQDQQQQDQQQQQEPGPAGS